MEVYGSSDVGLMREINEDSYYYGTNARDEFCAAVFDGIGGSAAGEVASAMARRILKDQFLKAPKFEKDYEVDEWLRLVLSRANDAIFTKSMWSKKNRGMGTTAVGTLILDIGTYIFNAGDSRLYALYDDGLIQMSEDHSVIQNLINQRKITPEEALTHEKRNMLTNALGVWKFFKIDINKIKSDWKALLICSDGLSSYVKQEHLAKVMAADMSAQKKVNFLIQMAEEAGGHDNCTVIVIQKEPADA